MLTERGVQNNSDPDLFERLVTPLSNKQIMKLFSPSPPETTKKPSPIEKATMNKETRGVILRQFVPML